MCTAPHCNARNILQHAAPRCNTLQHTAEPVLDDRRGARNVRRHMIGEGVSVMCCSVLQCVAVCCSVLQCVRNHTTEKEVSIINMKRYIHRYMYVHYVRKTCKHTYWLDKQPTSSHRIN